MRLDKLLSNLGFSSRSQCRDMIKKGRVQVNGNVCRDMAMHVPDGARVTLDGKEIDTRTERCLMLYKPSGVLTAAEDKNQHPGLEKLPNLVDEGMKCVIPVHPHFLPNLQKPFFFSGSFCSTSGFAFFKA